MGDHLIDVFCDAARITLVLILVIAMFGTVFMPFIMVALAVMG